MKYEDYSDRGLTIARIYNNYIVFIQIQTTFRHIHGRFSIVRTFHYYLDVLDLGFLQLLRRITNVEVFYLKLKLGVFELFRHLKTIQACYHCSEVLL